MATKWSDLANNNPFATDANTLVDTANSEETAAGMVDEFYIKACDDQGDRYIRVNVDNGTRSVYPTKEK